MSSRFFSLKSLHVLLGVYNNHTNTNGEIVKFRDGFRWFWVTEFGSYQYRESFNETELWKTVVIKRPNQTVIDPSVEVLLLDCLQRSTEFWLNSWLIKKTAAVCALFLSLILPGVNCHCSEVACRKQWNWVRCRKQWKWNRSAIQWCNSHVTRSSLHSEELFKKAMKKWSPDNQINLWLK